VEKLTETVFFSVTHKLVYPYGFVTVLAVAGLMIGEGVPIYRGGFIETALWVERWMAQRSEYL
jgi:hypothetical protein